MMTLSQQLNQQAGIHGLFAEKGDVYGLPINGWSLPTFTTAQNPTDKRVLFIFGSFRILPDGTVEKKHVSKEMSLIEFNSTQNKLIEIRDELFKDLVEALSVPAVLLPAEVSGEAGDTSS